MAQNKFHIAARDVANVFGSAADGTVGVDSDTPLAWDAASVKTALKTLAAMIDAIGSLRSIETNPEASVPGMIHAAGQLRPLHPIGQVQ